SAGGVPGYIKKGDLSRDRSFQRTDRFAKDEKLDAKIMTLDKAARKMGLSVKALEIEEEKKALSEYGSSDSGASLGDILGAAMNKAKVDAGKDSK
ncbi:MAG: 30S ribosomal protein S1, partial [Alphaproteobacteria bacterium]|nr:30S ribosomal protein S1 [Alphaproteobacteria bacterium]